MAEHSIKTAVVLYSVANFISDRNLVYLGQEGGRCAGDERMGILCGFSDRQL